jgi:hypothetical protein
MKKEKMNSAREINTFQLRSPSQRPEIQISFNVPIKNVKMKVPTIMPRAVPAK